MRIFFRAKKKCQSQNRTDKKVDLILLGNQKCGTTAFHSFISRNPDFIGSKPKELHYFSIDERYNKGERYYHSHFSALEDQHAFSGRKIWFDGTGGYLMCRKSPKRIHLYNPQAKMVVLVRNPIERAFSAYKMYCRFYSENKNWFNIFRLTGKDYTERKPEEFNTFRTFISSEIACEESNCNIDMPVLQLGKYEVGIKRYLQFFDRNQIKIFSNQDLLNNPVSTLNELTSFLNMDSYDWTFSEGKKVFEGKYKDFADPESENLLRTYYREYNKNLFSILDRDLGW